MNLLLIGSGAREHALAWKLKQSAHRPHIFAAPGNAGMTDVADCIDIPVTDHARLIAFARDNAVSLAVIGPEDPLAAGIVDAFDAAGIPAFGPNKAAAQLESSKSFVKALCAKHDIPTARSQTFASAEPAAAFLDTLHAPYVIKADGLAAGKGVVIAETHAEAVAAVRDMLGGSLGAAGHRIVIEEFLHGEEASFFVLCDGMNAVPLAGAQDHKRAFDGDKGPNTGGMGTYSPTPVLTEAHVETIMRRMVTPTLAAMRDMGAPFRGFLFVGVMIGPDGPKLVEYNARFGDPECQSLMLRLDSDLLDGLLAVMSGRADRWTPKWSTDVAVTVVMAAKGYPGAYVKGTVIRDLDRAAAIPGVQIFHAGTGRGPNGDLIATGGRTLSISARGPDIRTAQALAYQAVDLIDWPDGFCRRDIGWRAVAP
jgi:phosphoribosylamine---glycine ligase